VLGGYGYTRDFMVEQYWRDNRLNMIHEGTHGIQALDLLGRKVVMNGGAGLQLLATARQRHGAGGGTRVAGLDRPPTHWLLRGSAWWRPRRPPGPPACPKKRWPTPHPICRPLAMW
jgi:hypothetical protein